MLTPYEAISSGPLTSALAVAATPFLPTMPAARARRQPSRWSLQCAYAVLDLSDQADGGPPPADELADLWAFAVSLEREAGAPWPGRARHMREAFERLYPSRSWAKVARRVNAMAKAAWSAEGR